MKLEYHEHSVEGIKDQLKELDEQDEYMKSIGSDFSSKTNSTGRMLRRQLHTILHKRLRQTKYQYGIYLELEDYRSPKSRDYIFHFLKCHWLKYDDLRFFDSGRRICMICGKTESYAFLVEFWEETEHELTFEKLKIFVGARIIK